MYLRHENVTRNFKDITGLNRGNKQKKGLLIFNHITVLQVPDYTILETQSWKGETDSKKGMREGWCSLQNWTQ